MPQAIGITLLTMFGDGQGQGNPLTNGNQQRTAGGAEDGAPYINNENDGVHP